MRRLKRSTALLQRSRNCFRDYIRRSTSQILREQNRVSWPGHLLDPCSVVAVVY
jgi:hypothetical protein